MVAPANPAPMPTDFRPNPQQIADLEAAIQAIMKDWRVARVYGVSNDVAAKMLRGEIPYPGDTTGQNTYRPPAPPGYAWAYNPSTEQYEIVDTTPLDPTAPLEGWKWVLP